MESFNFNERGTNRKFYVSHRLQELENQFISSGGSFKEYKIGELFEKIDTKTLKYKVKDLEGKYDEFYSLPALTAGVINQGLSCYVPRNEATVLKNVISVSANGANTGVMFYQPEEFTVLQDSYAIRFKNKLLTDNQYLYFLAALQKTIYGNFDWTNKAGWNRIKGYYISLPTKNSQPDFDFMEEYIHVLEKERVHVLENYLQASGLDTYDLTDAEITALNRLRSGSIAFKEYKIGELFEIEGIRQAKSQSAIPNDDKGVPYVVQSQFNNMVSRFVNEKYLYDNNEPVCEGNAIVLGVTLAAVSYQDRKFGASQVITARAKFLNENIGNYFVALLRKLMVQFSYQNKPGIKIYKEMMISLPTKNDQPDFDFMETYIHAVEKVVIKNVVTWKDKEIEKTKEVVA